MLDITIDIGDYKLNVRAAAIIIHNNKLLVHKNTNKSHYALVGGRVKIGEDSKTAIQREIKEETGKDVEVLKCIAVIENFFEIKDSKYHEILFIHQVEFVNEEDKRIEYTLENAEGKEYQKYVWLDIDKIEKYNILPVSIKKIIKDKKFPTHAIDIQ